MEKRFQLGGGVLKEPKPLALFEETRKRKGPDREDATKQGRRWEAG